MQTSTPPLEIIFEDAGFVAIHKPSGMMVHPSKISRDRSPTAMEVLRDQLGIWVYPIHRIDRATSGILLFAKNKASAKLGSQMFENRQVEKEYLAIVRGHLKSGTIDHPLKEELDRITDKKANTEKEAQPALTHFQVVAQAEIPIRVDRYPNSRYSLVRLHPQTGRKHQLRRHMVHISHPIIGDTTHGHGKHNRFFRKHFECHRLLLAASRLSFAHPTTKHKVDLHCDPDDCFADIIETLFKQN